MKKSILIILSVSLIFGFYHPAISQEKVDGHFWGSLNNTNPQGLVKLAFISGYLNGYNTGYAWGNAKGSSEIYDFFFDEFAKKTIAEKSRKCSDLLISHKKAIAPVVALSFVGSVSDDNFKESVQYYVRELDSFYEAYPLCRGKELSEMLFMISQVWVKGGKLSYKDIGDGCLTKKNE